ncbi:phage holin family protein [Paucibacter sp. AS339]|uniref:phage holin family protein n=1 Tax=Paucibacter hankyongi TaxID=3133434 RepID=UPI0030B523D1
MSKQQEEHESKAGAMGGGAGLGERARRLLAHGLELLQTRVELLSTELEAEKLRLFAGLAQGFMALLLAAAALGMLSLCLLLLTPEGWRWLTALGLCLLYLGLALSLWQGARKQLSQPGGMFAGSAAELGRDRSALEP